MKEYYTTLREHWDQEAFYAKEPEVWISEALNLWLSAKVLYDQQREWIGDKEKTMKQYPAFGGHRIIRMLIGFAFENLIKAYLIKDKGKDAEWFRKEGNFKIGGNGHDLIWLFNEADFILDELERHYLGLCSMCALWAGRYPIAANENAMPRKRKPMPSSNDLFRRRSEMRDNYATDPMVKYGDYWDLLHSCVGDLEYSSLETVYKNLRDKLL